VEISYGVTVTYDLYVVSKSNPPIQNPRIITQNYDSIKEVNTFEPFVQISNIRAVAFNTFEENYILLSSWTSLIELGSSNITGFWCKPSYKL
jgi:hypothetical protein